MAFDFAKALSGEAQTSPTKQVAPTGTFDFNAALGGGPTVPSQEGGLIASAKQTAGQTIKGLGRLGADYIPGVSQDNALIRTGQEIVEANPTAVQGLRDIAAHPLTAVTEAVGQGGGTMAGMLGLRALGQGITAAAPFTGLASPVVAGLGQIVSWGGPTVLAALPSYSGIREAQTEGGATGTTGDKLLALGGAAASGAIEVATGPQKLIIDAVTKGIKRKAGEKLTTAIGKTALKSGLEEAGEELVQNPIEQLASYQNPTTAQNIQDTLFGGAMGFIGGGVLGGGVQAFGGQAAETPKEKDKRTIEQVQTEILQNTLGEGKTVVASNGQAYIKDESGGLVVAPIQSLADHFAVGGTLENFDTAAATKDSLDKLAENTNLEYLTALRNSNQALIQAGVNQKDIDVMILSKVEDTPGRREFIAQMLAQGQADPVAVQEIGSGKIESPNAPMQAEWQRQTELAAANNRRMLQRINEEEQRIQTERELVNYWQSIGAVETPEESQAMLESWREAQAVRTRKDAEDLAQAIRSMEQGGPMTAFMDQQSRQRNKAAQERLNKSEENKQKAAAMSEAMSTYSPEVPQRTATPAVTPSTEASSPSASELPTAAGVAPSQEANQLIFGRTWDQIKAMQQGAASAQNVSPSSKPVATEADIDLLRSEGLEGLQQKQFYGVIDRLTTSGILSTQQQEVTTNAQENGTGAAQGGQQEGTQGSAAGQVRLRDDGQPGVATQGAAQEGQVSPPEVLPSTATQVQGQPADRVHQDVKAFLGNKGYNNLTSTGKLNVVQMQEEVPIGSTPITNAQGTLVGAYDTRTGKIYLVSNNIAEGQAEDVFRHEAVHALVREDKAFIKQRASLLSEFEKLKATDASVQAAFARVPENTDASVRVEEALAYWQQNTENHKHSLFKRIIAAVRAALRRIGIPVGKYTTAELSRLFTRGTQAWAETAPALPTDTQSQALYSKLDKVLNKPTPLTVADDRILYSLADTSVKMGQTSLIDKVKQFMEDGKLDNASRWLSVMPLRTLEQTVGKKIKQVVNIARYLEEADHAQNNLVNESFEYYKKAMAFGDKVVDAMNRAAGTSSFYRMDPTKGMDYQEWIPADMLENNASHDDRMKAAQARWVQAGMDKSTGKSYIAAFQEARKAYNAIGSAEAKEQYMVMVGFMSQIREREKNNLLAYIERNTIGNEDLRNQLMARFNATFKGIHGAYWPLNRIGDYRLEYTDIDGVKMVQHYESVRARRMDEEQLIRDGVSESSMYRSKLDRRPRGEVAIPMELNQQLMTIVYNQKLSEADQNDPQAVKDAQAAAQDIIDEMNQIWLRWQPETSALKNSVQRKNVKGFDQDMMRSFLDYTRKHASNIAWTEQGRNIESELKSLSEEIKQDRLERKDPTFKGTVLTEMRNRLQAIRDAKVGPIASFLGKLGTAYYMTSPSIALVQMTQLPILTLPKLAIKYGSLGKATAAMTRAVSKSFSKDYSKAALFNDPVVNALHDQVRQTVSDDMRQKFLDPNYVPNTAAERAFIERIKDKPLGERVYDDAFIAGQFNKLTKEQQKVFVLREALARNLLDISAAHEAYALTQGKNPNSNLNKAFNYAMLPMKLSEEASRKAAILATMELAQEKGKDFHGIMNNVAEVVNDTLYSYSKANKPAILQGGTARILGMFQWYRIMTALRVGLLAKRSFAAEDAKTKADAQKEFVGIMGMTAMLAGTMGIPLMKTVFAALDALADDDEPQDHELMFRQWAAERLGPAWGDALVHGLPNVLGVNISRRVGMGDLYGAQSEPPPRLHGKELAAWWAANQLGPMFGVLSGGFQAYDSIMNKGEYLKGLEQAMPKPLRDGLRAARTYSEGEVKSVGGRKVLGEEDMTRDTIFLMALGLNPSEIAQASTNQMSKYRLSTAISERRGRIMRDLVGALQGDGDIAEAKQALVEFNRKMPRFAITGGDIRSSVVRSIKEDLGTQSRRDALISAQYGI